MATTITHPLVTEFGERSVLETRPEAARAVAGQLADEESGSKALAAILDQEDLEY
jgi:hypothetical protein